MGKKHGNYYTLAYPTKATDILEKIFGIIIKLNIKLRTQKV